MRDLDSIVADAINNHLAIQHPDELKAMLARVRALQPKVVLEIGSAQGGSWWAISQVIDEALMISVDMPSDHHMDADWAQTIGMSPRTQLLSQNPDVLRQRLMNAVKPNQTAVVIQGDSTSSSVLGQVDDALAGKKIDLAFIDGGHDYQTVLSDFATYGPLVREEGLIVFHDIATTGADVGSGAAIGVPRLWREIADSAPSWAAREYVALGSPCGIGIVEVTEGLFG